MSVPTIITANSVTVLIDGKTLVAKSTSLNFTIIREYLKEGAPDTAKLAALFSIAAVIEVKSNGLVTVRENEVLYNGKPLHGTLTTRMLSMMAEGFDINPLINFLGKLMKNPSFRAVNGLYDFLEATNIPITPEGDFLAFKKVRADYYDIYTGTIRNAVGDTPSMPRNEVNENPDQTCSRGLHVCSESYLPHFGSCDGNRVVVVQVNPADVVAIPKDYNNAKMRCSDYKVIAEVPLAAAHTAFVSAVMDASDFNDDDDYDFEDEGENELSSDETEVIRDVDGVVVIFQKDEEGGWVAAYTCVDGFDQETYLISDDLEDAVNEFRNENLYEVADYTATVVWLDESANRCTTTLTLADWPTDDGLPNEYDFSDAVYASAEVSDVDNLKFTEIAQMTGSKRTVAIAA